MKPGISTKLTSFLRGQSGNVAVTLAIAIVPLMMAGGAAVDYANWTAVQARLQAATDAAALAAGREINLSDAELRELATRYFMSNYGNPGNSGTPQMTLSQDSEGNIRVDARVTVENYLMKAAGMQSQVIAASAQVSKESTGLEVVLVFDNTGSMAQRSRLSTLKVAANDFVEILFGPRESADSLKIGVVPFSQFVNVGPDKASASWLDTAGRNPYSNDNFDASDPTYHNWKAWSDLNNRSWTGCVEARPGALAVDDTGPDPPTRQPCSRRHSRRTNLTVALTGMTTWMTGPVVQTRRYARSTIASTAASRSHRAPRVQTRAAISSHSRP